MGNTNKHTILYRREYIDLRGQSITELNALIGLLSEDINNISNQLDRYDRGELRNKDDVWREKASLAMNIKSDSIAKIRRNLQGRANNEEEYAYVDSDIEIIKRIERDIKAKVKEALSGIIPDEVIKLVMERIE